MQLMGVVMSFPRNSEIFGENEPADYVYRVISGSVRTYKILNDGRRQVGGFYLPGDIFGLEFAEEHSFSAEAITDAKVVVLKRSALTALAGRDAAIGRELFALTGRELRRVQDRVLLLVKSAQERVASFLLEMAERASGGNIVGVADVAPGHRRLSRPHHRDRFADAHRLGKHRRHRGADVASDRFTQSFDALPLERLRFPRAGVSDHASPRCDDDECPFCIRPAPRSLKPLGRC